MPQSDILAFASSTELDRLTFALSIIVNKLGGESMLQGSEFFVGSVADAQPLSVIMPRGKYEQPFLIAQREKEVVAVFIGTEHRFEAMPCLDNTAWKGVIVPNVTIEVDENSIFNTEERILSAGSLVRRDTRLMLTVRRQERFSRSAYDFITLSSGLIECATGMEVAFDAWSVMLGAGRDKRTLFKFEPQAD